ncbi:MAG: hypothetical protein U0441_26050 [Polyangiaceae bacterium]
MMDDEAEEPSEEPSLAEALEALHELPERLTKAAHVLGIDPEETPDADGPELPRVLATARAGVDGLFAFVRGATWPPSGPPKIALHREAGGAVVAVDASLSGAALREATTSFIAALRRDDARFLAAAELCGVLLGLAVEWTSAGFAPPVVLASLERASGRILTLGHALLPGAR